MKTPRYAPALRLAAAAAVALAGTSVAVPALAEAGSPAPSGTATPAPAGSVPAPEASPAATAAAAAQQGISDAGLAEAVRRDLGMTLQQFNDAGAQAKRAADAVPTLRSLPGYVGIRLQDGKTVVAGSGAALQARIDELNAAGPDEFTLQTPAPVPPVRATPVPASPAAGDC